MACKKKRKKSLGYIEVPYIVDEWDVLNGNNFKRSSYHDHRDSSDAHDTDRINIPVRSIGLLTRPSR